MLSETYAHRQLPQMVSNLAVTVPDPELMFLNPAMMQSPCPVGLQCVRKDMGLMETAMNLQKGNAAVFVSLKPISSVSDAFFGAPGAPFRVKNRERKPKETQS